ncbi:MAG: hypothetical protein M1822_001171 [Bathelium mastoideum]|nr:MAG: hypothetical protein M1822_001171 [Bathelium mastoideum]
MAEEDNFDVDPALAAAMGFSSFGQQPATKKRKHNPHLDAVVDAEPAPVARPSGANATKLGAPAEGATAKQQGKAPKHEHDTIASTPAGSEIAPLPASSAPPAADLSGLDVFVWRRPDGSVGKVLEQMTAQELEALRRGVKNEHGVTVCFLPSFIDPDPWVDLDLPTNATRKIETVELRK